MSSELERYLSNTPLTDINMTPLIDVTMVILIIFILIAPIMEQGITVKLPTAEKKAMETAKPFTISIAKDKKIYLGNTLTSLALLEQNLRNLTQATPERPVVLRADKNLPYALIVKVLDTIQNSGITKLGLATKAETLKP